MRLMLTIAALLGLQACTHAGSAAGSSPLIEAERLIDAFYSFDPARLRRAMADATTSQPRLLYYQGWAEGGNYAVLERKPCRFSLPGEISCDVTVRDDLIAALETGYWVTDTFHLRLNSGRIVSVRNSSNDPPDFDLAMTWLKRERPELMAGTCGGFFAGGPTPQACVRAVVKGFRAYRTANPRR